MSAVPPNLARLKISNLFANHSSVFRSTFISTSVLHSVFAFTAIFGNVLVLIAILKNLSIRTPKYALLVCLAMSDLGVGLVCHPLYVVWKVNWLINGVSDEYYQISSVLNIISTYFASVSFLTVTAVSCERYLALHYHLRYEAMVTNKHLLAAVLFPWVFPGLLTVLEFFFDHVNFYAQITVMPICLLTTAVMYVRIYSILRRHRNQITAQVQAMNHAHRQTTINQEFDIQKFRKSASNMLFVYLLLLACYLPHFVIVMLYTNQYTLEIGVARNFSLTGVYLNSSLNPILYCCRLSVIRDSIRKLFRCQSSSRNKRETTKRERSTMTDKRETKRERPTMPSTSETST